MASLCSVQGCRSNYQNGNDVVITFPLPKEEPLRSSWLSKIPTNLTEEKNPTICIEHFDKSQIIEIDEDMFDEKNEKLDRKGLKLKEGSLPSIFFNLPLVQNSNERLSDKEQNHLDRQSVLDHAEHIQKNINSLPDKGTDLKDHEPSTEDKVISIQTMESSKGDKVSRINATEDRFTIDGIVAEMIIEVDHPVNSTFAQVSPNKNEGTTKDVTEEKQIEKNIEASKVDFAKTLGLMCPKVEVDEPNEEVFLTESSHAHVKSEAVSDDFHLQAKTTIEESAMPKNKITRRKKTQVRQESQRILPSRNKNIKDIPKGPVFIPGDGVQLKEIPEFCERIQQLKGQGLRPLYRILYYSCAPDDVSHLKDQILRFSGFSFNNVTSEYTKRKQLIKVLPQTTLQNICSLFGIKFGPKLETVDNIMKFLMKPTIELHMVMAVKQPILKLFYINLNQFKKLPDGGYIIPSKKQERQEKHLSKFKQARSLSTSKKEKPTPITKAAKTPTTKAEKTQSTAKTVKTPSSRKIEKTASIARTGEIVSITKVEKIASIAKTVKVASASTSKPSYEKIDRKRKLFARDDAVLSEEITAMKKGPGRALKEPSTFRSRIAKKFNLSPLVKTKQKTGLENKKKKVSAIAERKTRLKRSLSVEREKLSPGFDNDTESSPERGKFENMSRRSADKRKKPKYYGEWWHDDESLSDFHSKDDEVESRKVKNKVAVTPNLRTRGKKMKIEKSAIFSSSDDSEESGISSEESSDEEESMTSSNDDVVEVKKRFSFKVETPLKKSLASFPSIKRRIESASSRVLQKLHVLLYETFDEHDKMVRRLLSFDGFKFSEGSEDWTHYKFLFSIVSRNELKELVELLCLAGCNQPNMTPKRIIECVMTFLKEPRANLLLGVDDDSTNEDDDVVEIKTVTKCKPKVTTPNIHVPEDLNLKKELSKTKSKKKRKDDVPKKGSRSKKILMDDEEVKKLEMEIAREDRAKRRAELQQPASSNLIPYYEADYGNSQARSMLTVIKNNRALKTAGLDPVTPTSSNRIARLGDNNHVKFMIVTLNYPDLEILHNVIFLHNAVKSRIRRNILDFEGFRFDESSPKYKFREIVLRRLGVSIVKRITFIFGLTPLKTNLLLKDLIDLIMHFLMCPSKIKQVPIKEFPSNFFQQCPRGFQQEKIFEGLPPDAYIEKPQWSCNSELSKDVYVSDSDETDDSEESEQSMENPDEGIPIAEVVISNHVAASTKNKKSNSPTPHMQLKKSTPVPKWKSIHQTQNTNQSVMSKKKLKEPYSVAQPKISKQSTVTSNEIGGKNIVTPNTHKIDEKPNIIRTKINTKPTVTSRNIDEKPTVTSRNIDEKPTVTSNKTNEKLTLMPNKNEHLEMTLNKGSEQDPLAPKQLTLKPFFPASNTNRILSQRFGAPVLAIPQSLGTTSTYSPNSHVFLIRSNASNNSVPSGSVGQSISQPLQIPSFIVRNNSDKMQPGNPVILYKLSSNSVLIPVTSDKNKVPPLKLQGLPIPSSASSGSLKLISTVPSNASPAQNNAVKMLNLTAITQSTTSNITSMPAMQKIMIINKPGVQTINANPLIRAVNANPAVQTINSNPAVQTINSNPAVQIINANPLIRAVNANPLIRAVNANPLIRAVNANPLIRAVNANPAVKTINSNPAVQTINLNPAIQIINSNPAVKTINSNPAVQTINSNHTPQIINSNPTPQIINSNLAVQTVTLTPKLQKIAKESITPNTSIPSPLHNVTMKSFTPPTVLKLPSSVTVKTLPRAYKSFSSSSRKNANPAPTVFNVSKYSSEDYVLKETSISDQPVEIFISDSDESDKDEEEKEVDEPNDQQLFNAIRDIIHCSDMEDITLRIISQKLTALFSRLNLRERQDFIKDSIKKVISGMTSSTDSS